MLQRKNMQILIESLLREARLKSVKPYIISCAGELKNLCFNSVALVVWSHEFIYDVVDVNKTAVISSIKLPSCVYMHK